MARQREEKRLIKALEMVAPGTELREALEHIIKAGTGALIVIGDSERVKSLSSGGFEFNAPFSTQKLFELAKMDGAIILDEEISRILRANVHLVPNPRLPTKETGIRHRTAERVAKQTKALVISISQRRDVVYLYAGNIKYTLEDIRSILAKANQALQTLERYKTSLNEVSANLNALEFEDLVTLSEVALVIQRFEMVRRVAEEIERYISELGTEGRLIKMQLEELMAGVEEDNLMALKDYCRDPKRAEKTRQSLSQLESEVLLDPLEICRFLGYKDGVNLLDQPVHPKGYRLLNRVPRLPTIVVGKIVAKFGDLQTLIQADLKELDTVEGVGEARARIIQEGLKRLREYSLVERAL